MSATRAFFLFIFVIIHFIFFGPIFFGPPVGGGRWACRATLVPVRQQRPVGQMMIDGRAAAAAATAPETNNSTGSVLAATRHAN